MGISEEFIKNLNQSQYISNALFHKVLTTDRSIIPANFNLEQYNNNILDKQCLEHQEYFDHILDEINPEIKLDDEQRKAILADEDQALIIAGAGTGKTTTMTAKVKYLVDIKKIDPKRILVMSYTRKNVEELRNRINIDLQIPAIVTTFHSLGYKYLKNMFQDKKSFVINETERSRIFLDFFRNHIYNSPTKLANFIECFNEKTLQTNYDGPLYGSFLRDNYSKYPNFDSYFSAYKEKRISEADDIDKIINDRITKDINSERPRTIKGERVKSKGEAKIANFLFNNNIDYEYEEIYEEILPDNDIYRPDFTLSIGGEKIYVEYFGMSEKTKGNNLSTYDKERRMKEAYHKSKKNKFISLDYAPNSEYLEDLKKKLTEFGFKLHQKSSQEIYDAILNNNPLVEIYKLKNWLYTNVVDVIKSSPKREDYVSIIEKSLEKSKDQLATKQYDYIHDFLVFYSQALYQDKTKLGLDYSDLIYFSRKYIDKLSREKFNYDYIIIDEYQDISFERYDLARKTIERSGAKLLAIGDDWQTIYSFSGSKIEYIYNFQKYFENAKLLKITKTYRNAQSLINYAGQFIMKNPVQIKKNLISDKNLTQPFVFYNFSGKGIEARTNEYAALKNAIIQIHRQRPNDTVLVLARKNRILNDLVDADIGFRDELDTKVSISGIPNFKFDAMTIHKAKGLTADWTIIIGLDKTFPSSHGNGFWISNLFKQKPLAEPIEFAEERRIFYVALTRSKYRVILLRNTNSTRRSPFLDELWDMTHPDIK